MKKKLLKLSLGLAAIAAVIFASITVTVPGFAQSVGDLAISNIWIRATPPGAKAGGGFLKISNNGSSDDTLVAVEFAGAKKSEIHEMKIVEGIMKMRPLADGITIPAGGSTILKPGGFHLMFMGLKQQLKQGQVFEVKLSFAKSGEISLEFPVLALEKGKNMMMQGN